MRLVKLFRVLSVVAALAAPTAAYADQEPSCRSNPLASLALTFDETGRPFIPVSIQGHGERFLVDTGASYGMLSWQTAAALGLQRFPAPRHVFYMMNGTSMEYYSTAHDVELGAIKLDSKPFLIMPPTWNDEGVTGSIAPDTLSHFDVDFDFGGGRINLIAPDSCDDAVTWTRGPRVALPLRIDRTGTLHVTATLDGQEIDAIIDTGSGASVLRADEANAVLGHTLDDSDLVKVGTGPSNGWNTYRHTFKQLSIGGIVVRDPDLLIMTDKLSQVHEPDEVNKGFRIVGMQAPALIIGMNVLRQLHIYIAYKQNLLYATAADAH